MPGFNLEAVLADLRIQGGDTAAIEVKSARGGLPSTIGESLCALANHPGGGLILLGVDERAGFLPTGLTDPQAMKQGLASIARTCTPPVGVEISQHETQGHTVIAVQVSECDKSAKPCRIRGRGWLRAWDGDYAMSPEEEQAFLRLRDAPHADKEPVPGTSLADLDPNLTHLWLETARGMDPIGLGRFGDDEECLMRAGVLLPNGETSKAGLLVLGIHPQQHFPRYVVNLARDGDGHRRASELATISGPIPLMLEGALSWARRAMERRAAEHADGSLHDEWAYPLVALRELIANALVHRDLDHWSQGSAVEVRLQQDRFVITNPGGLYGITADRLGKVKHTSARNGTLIEICRYARAETGARVVETLASGIPRVIESLQSATLPMPLFDDRTIAFTVVLRQNSAARSTELTPTQTRILMELGAGPLEVREIEHRTGLKGPTIRKAIRALGGRIEVIGGKGRLTTYSRRDTD